MSRAPLAGLLAVVLSQASCGSTVVEKDPGNGGGDAGVDAKPEPDPCEAIDRDNCCDAGCEPAPFNHRNDPECVSKSRLCYVEGDCGGQEAYEKGCPPGYECVVASYPCFDPCHPSGEISLSGRGYCIWTGS